MHMEGSKRPLQRPAQELKIGIKYLTFLVHLPFIIIMVLRCGAFVIYRTVIRGTGNTIPSPSGAFMSNGMVLFPRVHPVHYQVEFFPDTSV